MEKVSIFVDVQNIYYTCRQAYRRNFDYNRFWAQATEGRELVGAWAYATHRGDEKQMQFQNILRGIGFEVKLKAEFANSEKMDEVEQMLLAMPEVKEVTYQRNLGADDVVYQVETSSTLAGGSWVGGAGFTEYVSMVDNGDGTAAVTWRSATPISGLAREFIRLVVSSRP